MIKLFFGDTSKKALSVLNFALNIIILLYLFSVHGFSHINKDFIINAFLGLGFVSTILAVLIIILSMVFVISFKIAYKKLNIIISSAIDEKLKPRNRDNSN